MDISLELLYLHTVLTFIISFFTVGKVRKDLYYSLNPLLLWRRYTGKRAIVLGVCILALFVVIADTSLQPRLWFDLGYFLFSLVIAIPLAYATNLFLRCSAKREELVTEVEEMPPHKVTLSRFFFFFIAGGPAGFLFGLAFYLTGSHLLIATLVTIVLSVLISWLLARANWQ